MNNNALNKILSVVLILSFSFSLSAYDWQKHVPSMNSENSNKSDVSYGPVSKNNVAIQDLTVYGPLSLTNSTVKGSLTVHGPVTLENTIVKGSLTLYGVMETKNSSLNDIQAATTKLTFLNTDVKNIVILKNGNDVDKQQQIFLYGPSTVSGTITFQQGNGKVTASPNARVSGAITGGTLSYTNRE